MEDGEIVNEEIRKDIDITSKIEKCVVDETAHENSDKEDGELDDENDADNVPKSEDATVEHESVQNTGSSEVKETDTSAKVSLETQATVESNEIGQNMAEKEPSPENDMSQDDKDLNDVQEENTLEDEEGELHDSIDEDIPNKTDDSEHKTDNSLQNTKETASVRMEFDESRPEEEQLDYGEDELEEKIKEPRENMSDNKKSDGEADSDSEGEIKSDVGDDFEEGETRDHPLDMPPEKKKVCRFFEMGNCTWGDRCRYLHPGVNDKGNYDMFCDEPPKRPEIPLQQAFHPPPHLHPDPFWEEPPPFIPPPAAETAWEKGLRHAKEMKKRALQRKVQEPDFLQKREVISTIGALNEDRDMEFVNIVPLTNKGYDPFKEEESGEYATPTAEEVRRHLNRDRRHAPPGQRHHSDKDHHRLPPPDHMMHSDSRRERRPPSPRRERYPHEGRGMLPRRDIERERPGHFPPNELGFAPQFNDRRDRHNFQTGSGQGMHHPDAIRREPVPGRVKDERYVPDGPSKGAQNGGPPSGQSQTWSDPWARGRPQTKGRHKAKSDSSSSSDSSSGSSSRSSSSGSSRSSYSSKSSSSGSDSSSYSSDRDSSRSPSPSKDGKKKVLASVKQRNAAPGVMKKNLPPQKAPPLLKPAPSQIPATATNKPVVPIKNPPLNKTVPNPAVPTAPPVKSVPKKKARKQSSSSSEFSHSSDSSPSPSRAKNKSESDSDSGSSSGSSSSSASSSSSSSSSDSEGDKPANRRKRKPLKPPTSQMQRNLPHQQLPPSQQSMNKGKVMVPSKPGRKDIKMTIIDKPGMPKKRTAAEMTGQGKKSASRRNELLEQLKAVEDAIARKRAKMN